jgi:ribosomal protein S18 acetylase RimI-like enzyme
MSIDLRAARPDDYRFAFQLYATTIKPYASAWPTWNDEDQEAHFAMLWRPDDTRIIVLDGRKDVGWLEARRTGSEVFLKQLYVAPTHQRQGIGSRVVRKLLDEWRGTAASMALFVLKNNPAARLYERLGFAVVQETRTKFVMRRELIDCALGGHPALEARVHAQR